MGHVVRPGGGAVDAENDHAAALRGDDGGGRVVVRHPLGVGIGMVGAEAVAHVAPRALGPAAESGGAHHAVATFEPEPLGDGAEAVGRVGVGVSPGSRVPRRAS